MSPFPHALSKPVTIRVQIREKTRYLGWETYQAVELRYTPSFAFQQ
jgi:hypothetical protein